MRTLHCKVEFSVAELKPDTESHEIARKIKGRGFQRRPDRGNTCLVVGIMEGQCASSGHNGAAHGVVSHNRV